MKTTKRGATVAALVVGLALVAAACSSDSKSSSGTSASGSSPSGSSPSGSSAPTASGGTVTYAAEQEFTSYNNLTADQVLAANGWVTNLTQPQPFIYEPDLSLTLDKNLMVSADVTSKDPQTVEYVIQPNAVWSDGKPIDCSDFYLSWMSQNGKVTKPNPAYTGPGQKDADGNDVTETLPVFNPAGTTGYEDVGSVKCSADGKTVTVAFDKIYVDWQSLFSTMMPAHIVAEKAGVADITKVDATADSPELDKIADFWNKGFVGFDPAVDVSGMQYTIDSFTAGQNLILKRNEKYYGKPGILDQIVLLQVPDATQQPAALQNGDVQVITPQPNPDLVAQLEAVSGITTSLNQGVTFEHYDFNQANVHLKDPNVRKALSMCIDRDEILKTLVTPINPDASVLNNRMYIPTSPDYKDNSGGLKQDIPGAKALLEKSGYTLGSDGVYAKDGNRLSLRLGRRDPNPRRQQTNELFAEQCKQAGIELTDDPAEDFNAVRLPASDYDIALFAWIATPFQSSNQSIYTAGGGQNWNSYDNPEVADLFTKANVEFDPVKRADLMNQIDKLIWSDMATLPLFQFQELTSNSDSVTGVVYNGPQGITWNAQNWAVTK